MAGAWLRAASTQLVALASSTALDDAGASWISGASPSTCVVVMTRGPPGPDTTLSSTWPPVPRRVTRYSPASTVGPWATRTVPRTWDGRYRRWRVTSSTLAGPSGLVPAGASDGVVLTKSRASGPI